MFKNQVIQKIAAAALLIVFAFSITPAIVFHNWLADHTDTLKKASATNHEQVGKQTFNCDCDNILAQSPFTEPEKEIITPVENLFSSVKVDKPVHFTTSPHHFYSLRGPPAV